MSCIQSVPLPPRPSGVDTVQDVWPSTYIRARAALHPPVMQLTYGWGDWTLLPGLIVYGHTRRWAGILVNNHTDGAHGSHLVGAGGHIG